MSSNYIEVYADEWRELQQYLKDVDAYMVNLSAENQRIREAARQRMQELAAMQRRQQEAARLSWNALTEGYQEMLRSVHGTAAAATRQDEQFTRDLETLRQEVDAASAKIHTADHQVDVLAGQYNAVFQAMQAKQLSAKHRAEAFQKELEGLLARMEALEPERFLSKEYGHLTALRASVAANMTAGDYGAALVVSHNGILDAAAALTRLTLRKERFDRQYYAVRTRAAELRSRVEALDASSGVLRAELHGQQLEYDYDINYWSRGAFGGVKERLGVLETRLAGGLTPAQLELVSQELTELEAEAAACDANARQALLGAIFAEDTAVRLWGSLAERGWTLEEAGHYEAESLEPYVVRCGDGKGNTVSIVVSSGRQGADASYDLEVFCEDEYNADTVRNGVLEAVAAPGLEVRNTQRRNDCSQNPDPETFVSNMVRRQQAQLT